MSEARTTFHVEKDPDGLWCVTSPDHRGLLIAGDTMHNALLQVQKALDDMASVEPPAPPAWMVEVAREGHAIMWDGHGNVTMAKQCRSGERDSSVGHMAAIHTLRLAIERGHVVESGAAGPAVSSADLEAAAHRAWNAGLHAAEMLILAMRKGSLQDRGEAVRDVDVQNILSCLSAREA